MLSSEVSMNRHDLFSGLFWFGISVFVIYMAFDLGVGPLSNPGAGFVLFWSGIIFGVLSIVLVVKAVLGKGGPRLLSDSWKGLKWSKVLITVIALSLYAGFLTVVGFLITTFCLMALLYGLGKPKPIVVVAGSFVTIALTYIIFHFGLQIQFPRGILGW
jgi:putative tricarboxylic transport membrane protein